MKHLKNFLMTFLMVSMMLFVPMNVSAASIITSDEESLISQVLTYFSEYTDGDFNEDNGWTASEFKADIDIDRCLMELKKLNPSLGQAYTNIIDYWKYADTTMQINKDVLPDGLPNDNSLCIVTLGFQLNQITGEMQPELIDRLNVTLASAKKYPNAYIVVTGGGTSPAAPDKTEGGEMAKWLIENGVNEERIIVENRAPTTVGNAIYSFELLKKKPEVKSIAMISSASHIQRAVAIFKTVFELEAYKTNSESIEIISNASCPVSRKEKLSQQVAAIQESTNYCLESDVKLLKSMKLSTLNNISLLNVNDKYDKGSKVEPQVIADFTTFDGKEFKVDITDQALIQMIDTNKIGKQVLNVKYSYNDVTKEIKKNVLVEEAKNEVEKPDSSNEGNKEDEAITPTKPENDTTDKNDITSNSENSNKHNVPNTGVSTNLSFVWFVLLGTGFIAFITMKYRKTHC